MSTLPTPTFNTTNNQEATTSNLITSRKNSFVRNETNRKLKDFTVKEIEFNEEEIKNKIQNLVNREYPQPYPLKSQMPESFTSEFIMKPLNLVDAQRYKFVFKIKSFNLKIIY